MNNIQILGKCVLGKCVAEVSVHTYIAHLCNVTTGFAKVPMSKTEPLGTFGNVPLWRKHPKCLTRGTVKKMHNWFRKRQNWTQKDVTPPNYCQ